MSRQLVLAACAVMLLSSAGAYAGPCNTGKDAGSGPTPGATGQTITTGSADTDKEHPPTKTMNNVAGSKAMSAQDAQKQQQGQPTAAQQAQGAKPSPKVAEQGC